MFQDLPIAGITKMTTVDFPSRLSAVVFIQGCPWRCPYCHNPEMQKMCQGEVPFEELETFLNKRIGLLDGIVYSGGDPLVYKKMPELLKWTKDLGFDTGMHTGGHLHDNFEKCLAHLDWVGFDMKAPFDDYEKVTKAAHSGEYAKKSLKNLLSSGIEYEVRTTASPDDLSIKDIYKIADDLKILGVENFVLQEHRQICGDKESEAHHFIKSSSFFMNEDLMEYLKKSFKNFSVRRA
ncbi:MAG: anaerobic ribonucleoside-triphosphate reductase activating protein [Alphaproteobacteria bacterium]|jgi:anaerobic ribonucleoside-triphosphate reductase activating protein|nr:anaerobic ribonucleoside-triphosphate reductase activating protein [Alphaproteobacteria bacterium]